MTERWAGTPKHRQRWSSENCFTNTRSGPSVFLVDWLAVCSSSASLQCWFSSDTSTTQRETNWGPGSGLHMPYIHSPWKPVQKLFLPVVRQAATHPHCQSLPLYWASYLHECQLGLDYGWQQEHPQTLTRAMRQLALARVGDCSFCGELSMATALIS